MDAGLGSNHCYPSSRWMYVEILFSNVPSPNIKILPLSKKLTPLMAPFVKRLINDKRVIQIIISLKYANYQRQYAIRNMQIIKDNMPYGK